MRVGFKGALALLAFGIILGYSLQFVFPGEKEIISNTASETFAINNASLFICPEDECSQRLIEFIDSAEESVHVMIYSLTKKEIAEALARAKNRGLDVRVIMDRTQSASVHSKDWFLIERGIEVKIVDPAGFSVMHHKVTIVDGNSFSTGSFNYTKNADTGNAENLLIVKNKAFAQKMEKEFEKHWSE